MSVAMTTCRRQFPDRRGGRALAAGCALLLAVTWLLAGCGRTSSPGSDATASSATADSGAGGAAGSGADAGAAGDAGAGGEAGDAGATSDADLVSAVTPGGQSAPLSVKFRVEARPVIGVPVKILLVVVPADQDEIGMIHGSLSAGDGLLIQSPPTFDLSDLKPGTSQTREVTVVPQQTGVLNLNATLLLQTDNTTQTRTYSIPVIAADNSSP
jgi:hypothetical protein